MKKHKKGKEVSPARHQAKIKRRAKRKAKLATAIVSKLRPLLVKIEQLKAQVKFAQREEVNGSKEERHGQGGSVTNTESGAN